MFRIIDPVLFNSAAFVRFAGAAVAAAPLDVEERQELRGALSQPDLFRSEPQLAASLTRVLQPHAGIVAMLQKQALRPAASVASGEELFDIYHADDPSFVPAMRERFSDMCTSSGGVKDIALFIDPRNAAFIAAAERGTHHKAILEVLSAGPSNNYLGLISGILSVLKEDLSFQLTAVRADPFLSGKKISSPDWIEAARMVYASKSLQPYGRRFQVWDSTIFVMLSAEQLPAGHAYVFEDHREGHEPTL